MAHREGIRLFLKDVEVSGVVIDWGCGTKPIKNYLKKNDAKFINIDKLKHVEADIVVNLEDELDLNILANYAFCIEVIEHIWDSRQLLKNIHQHLHTGGILYLSQPFFYEVHKDDDRIRYTSNGLKQLLKECGFTVLELAGTGGEENKELGYVVKAIKE